MPKITLNLTDREFDALKRVTVALYYNNGLSSHIAESIGLTGSELRTLRKLDDRFDGICTDRAAAEKAGVR